MEARKPSEKPFHPRKPCRLRDGREVIIHTIKAANGYPIQGRIVGSPDLRMWNAKGETSIAPGHSVVRYLDLVNVSESGHD